MLPRPSMLPKTTTTTVTSLSVQSWTHDCEFCSVWFWFWRRWWFKLSKGHVVIQPEQSVFCVLCADDMERWHPAGCRPQCGWVSPCPSNVCDPSPSLSPDSVADGIRKDKTGFCSIVTKRVIAGWQTSSWKVWKWNQLRPTNSVAVVYLASQKVLCWRQLWRLSQRITLQATGWDYLLDRFQNLL